jgi:hypothetical protein
MANDQTVNVNINASDKGTLAKVTKDADKLNLKLTEAQKTASRIPNAVAAARQGVSASNRVAAGMNAMGQAADDSNSARGVGGLTGAAGRDFAAQARGLGGLVHVYATFAANLFAVSAAFTALNKAANIENMVKGLDQLGAASGKNLGTLAKSLVEVSDGALSLADSMTAVAQASAGGMSAQNIVRMTEIAKKASQALGRDLPDALNRLTRGITKIEPELLDELGIMVKVDEASRMYAQSLGKSASALTDFEKRQGYANAVLAEGERKFGAINLDANPYQKILASVQNLAIEGANLINTVLGPILEILSKSPAALAIALGAIVTTLVKQAVPGISAWKEGLERSAEAARRAVVETNKLRMNTFNEEGSVAVEKAMAARTSAEAAQLKLMGANKALREASRFDIATASKAELDALKRVAAEQNKLTLQQAFSEKGLSEAVIKKRDAQQVYVNELIATTKLYQEQEAIAKKIENESLSSAKKTSKERLAVYFTEAAQRQRIADSAAAKSQRINIVNDAVRSAPTTGIINAWKEMTTAIGFARDGLDKTGKSFTDGTPRMGRFSAGLTLVRGTALLAAQGISVLAASLSSVFAIVGIFVTAIMLLDTWFTTAKKEASEFSSALENLEGSISTVDKTLDSLDSKKAEDIISVESTQAKANAMNELTDAVSAQVRAFDKLKSAQGIWDKVWDGFWDMLGRGSADKLTESLSKAVVSSFKLLEDDNAIKAAQDSISNILGKSVDLTNVKQIEDALSGTDLSVKANDIAKAFKEINLNINNSASALTSFKTGMAESIKLVENINAALKPNDNQGKLGAQLINDSFNLGKALEEPVNALKTLKDLSGNMKALSLLPEDTAKELAFANKELNKLAEQLAIVDKTIATEREKISKSEGKFVQDFAGGPTRQVKSTTSPELEAAKQERESIKQFIDAKVSLFRGLDTIVFTKGVEHLTKSLNLALIEGANIAARGYLSVLKSAGGDTAQAETSLRERDIKSQIDAINATYANIATMEKLKLALEELANKETIRIAQEDANSASDARRESALPRLIKALEEEKVLARRREFVNSPKSYDNISKSNIVDPITAKAVQASADLFVARIQQKSQTAKLQGELTANRVIGAANVIDESLGNRQKELKLSNDLLNADLERVKRAQTLSGIFDQNLANQEDSLSSQILANKYASDALEIAKAIAKANLVGGKDAQEAISRKQNEQAALAKKYEEDSSKLKQDSLIKQLSGLEEIRQYEEALNTKRLKNVTDLSNAEITYQEAILSYRQSLNYIDEDTLARERAKLELIKQNNAYTLETNEARIASEKIIADLEINKQKLQSQGLDISSVQKRIDDETSSYKQQQIVIDEKNKKIIEGIKLQEAANVELARQKEIMDLLVNSTASLALAFGDVGAAIGAAAIVIEKTAQKQIESEMKIKMNREKYKDSSDPEQVKRLAESERKYAYETANIKLDLLQETTFAAKKAFGEQSKAGKALAAAEKAIALVKLGWMAKELAFKLGLTSATVTGEATQTAAAVAGSATRTTASVAEASVDGTAAVVKSLASLPFPANLAAGAAIAAVVASLLSGIGGDSPSVPAAGVSAADRQEVQGTGTSYVKGNKVENGGGVFGDSEAKSNSVINSLDIIKANSIEGLAYDNKVLKALQSIDAGVNNTAKTIYSIAGLRSGSISGTADSSTSTSGIKNLFGKSTTKDIVDSGLLITGTFSDLARSADGLVKAYETIRTTTTKSGFFGIGGGTKTRTKTSTKEVDDAVEQEISSIFKNAQRLFIEVGSKIGQSATQVIEKLNSVDIGKSFTSLRGLKGEELEKEFNSVISNLLDTTATTLFKNMEKFRIFGEGMLETVIRVTDGNEKVKVALDSIGSKLSDVSLDISEALVTSAGSIEDFTSQITFFSDNFLTEAQRLEPITKNVTSTLARLGYASVDTREEFANLVRSLDLTKEYNVELYQSLMDIAPAFARVYEETRAAATAEDLRAEKISQMVDILRLEGKVTESLILSRTEELAALDETLRIGQQYIWDLEDRLDILKAESGVLSALGFTYEALLIDRQLELRTLTDQQKILKSRVFLLQDEAKTQSLNLELLDALGKTEEATTVRRLNELKALSASDAALKSRIFQLQDETKLLQSKVAQEMKINTLLGKEEQNLALIRAQELATLEDSLIPNQLYIYALEDQLKIKDKLKTAYEKETTAIKATISSLQESIKTLRKYREELLVGDTSILTPAQKYAETKAQAMQVAAIATGIATTDAEKAAKEQALADLPNVSNAFLEASRIMYASSEQYTKDFNTVRDLIAATESSLGTQLTEAQKQLDYLDSTVTLLGIIEENTETTAMYIQKYMEQLGSVNASILGTINNLYGITVENLQRPTLSLQDQAMYDGALSQVQSTSLGLNSPTLEQITNPIPAANDATISTTNPNGEVTAYTNDPALLETMRSIQFELAELRKEQEQQTANLVMAQYDSTQKSAEIARLTAEAAAQQAKWNAVNTPVYHQEPTGGS